MDNSLLSEAEERREMLDTQAQHFLGLDSWDEFKTAWKSGRFRAGPDALKAKKLALYLEEKDML